MYLHLGRDITVSSKDIVGIFDLDTTSYGKRTREFLSKNEKEGRLVNISDDIPKSFVVCKNNRKNSIYISQISSGTLLKRAGVRTVADNLIG